MTKKEQGANKRKEGREAPERKQEKLTTHLLDKVCNTEASGVNWATKHASYACNYGESILTKTEDRNRIYQDENRYMIGCQDPEYYFLHFWYFLLHIIFIGASLMAQMVKNPPAMQDTQVLSLGWEDPLEKEMAIHSSIFA